MLLRKYAVIVAGGKGLRMNSEIPKQFMNLKGVPVLMHTVNAFFFADLEIEIILVLPESSHGYWKQLVKQYEFEVPHKIVAGGSTRFQSVRKGLEAIASEEGLVAVHDGVRPMISHEIIKESYRKAQEKESAVVVVPSKDSIRMVSGQLNKAVERSNYFLVQTPQTFNLHMLREAYEQEEISSFTDDASVFESMGKTIYLVDGDYKNIKITTPEDMILAECFLVQENDSSPQS